MTQISFCIPTYNHAAYIDQALDSIISCWDDDCEIVIVDGASTDNTQQICERYAARHPRIKYIRQPVNSGVDPDIAVAIDEASGEYCWLFSSDDLLARDGLLAVRMAIGDGSDIYLGARLECSREMDIFGVTRWFALRQNCRWRFDGDESLARYFAEALSIGALFSYISCIVFRRSRWVGADTGSLFFGSCYAHAHRLLKIIKEGAALTFISTPIVLCRSDNDQFSARGIVRRYLLDFEGYSAFSDDLFTEFPKAKMAILGVLRRDHRFARIVKLFAACEEAQKRHLLKRVLGSVGYPRVMIGCASLLGRATFLIDYLVWFRRISRRSIGKMWNRFRVGA